MSFNFSPITQEGYVVEARKRNRERSPFNDARLFQNWNNLLDSMESEQSLIVHRIGLSRFESERYYRLLKNNRIKIEETIQLGCQINPESYRGRHVLVIGDTTSISLNAHTNRIQDIEKVGYLEDNKLRGFYAHASLVVDCESQSILGLSDFFYWTRPQSMPASDGKKKKNSLAFEEKESQKWQLGIRNSNAVLENEIKRTHVFDRQVLLK